MFAGIFPRETVWQVTIDIGGVTVSKIVYPDVFGSKRRDDNWLAMSCASNGDHTPLMHHRYIKYDSMIITENSRIIYKPDLLTANQVGDKAS